VAVFLGHRVHGCIWSDVYSVEDTRESTDEGYSRRVRNVHRRVPWTRRYEGLISSTPTSIVQFVDYFVVDCCLEEGEYQQEVKVI